MTESSNLTLRRRRHASLLDRDPITVFRETCADLEQMLATARAEHEAIVSDLTQRLDEASSARDTLQSAIDLLNSRAGAVNDLAKLAGVKPNNMALIDIALTVARRAISDRDASVNAATSALAIVGAMSNMINQVAGDPRLDTRMRSEAETLGQAAKRALGDLPFIGGMVAAVRAAAELAKVLHSRTNKQPAYIQRLLAALVNDLARLPAAFTIAPEPPHEFISRDQSLLDLRALDLSKSALWVDTQKTHDRTTRTTLGERAVGTRELRDPPDLSGLTYYGESGDKEY